MTTTSAASLRARRRRLLFRATHRGTKEADLLVGGYVAPRLESLCEADIALLERLLEYPDPLLADWLTARQTISADDDMREMLARMRSTLLAAGNSQAESLSRPDTESGPNTW